MIKPPAHPDTIITAIVLVEGDVPVEVTAKAGSAVFDWGPDADDPVMTYKIVEPAWKRSWWKIW